jgi:hypothetical protein
VSKTHRIILGRNGAQTLLDQWGAQCWFGAAGTMQELILPPKDRDLTLIKMKLSNVSIKKL